MKKIILFLIIITIIQVSYAQEEVAKEEPKAFTMVENMPSWKGCEEIEKEAQKTGCTYEKIMDYLINEIKYPEVAKTNRTQGKVFVNFIINENGKVTEPVILRGVSPEIDAEAIRVVSLMPDWNPGMQKGKNVAVQYSLPINFTLKERR